MKRSHLIVVGVALACGVLGTVAVAQPVEEISVQAKRALSTKVVDRSPSGVPIVDITISYGVSTSGIDLTSNTGFGEMEKRVNEAARAACVAISHQYPDASPDEATCTKHAAAKAMVQVRKLALGGPMKPAG
ncbi:MAG: UrcA family protein [Proteobacteria bacterium]|nr:UrcA family protein [Pseudomonadota bacterium]